MSATDAETSNEAKQQDVANESDKAAGEAAALSCISETTLTPEQMLEMYRYLKLTRLVEERLVNLYRQTKVVGGVFRSARQEATRRHCLRITAAGFHHAFNTRSRLGARRFAFARYFRAVYGKGVGPAGGRDLNIHFGDMSKGFIGPISHLGDMIPVMTGVLGARMQKRISSRSPISATAE
jgi:pyruvate dehydrogenase E1 component alpha subunit/2-oxoisovalerate dehydrogenase E1 component alpha subunit